MDENRPARLESESVAGRPMTKRELKALRRLEKLDTTRVENKQNRVKWILLVGGSLLFLAFFGVLVILAKQNNTKSEAVNLSDAGWSKGVANSKITLVEFADFQCPACRAYHPIVREVLNAYDGELKLIYKHFPLTSIHPNAFAAAKAAEAAGAQGKFFEYHDVLYEKQDEWAGLPKLTVLDKFVSYAVQLSLSEKKFKADLENIEFENKIREQQIEGIASGVSSTPTFFLDGKIIKNPRSIGEFKKLIDKELK